MFFWEIETQCQQTKLVSILKNGCLLLKQVEETERISIYCCAFVPDSVIVSARNFHIKSGQQKYDVLRYSSANRTVVKSMHNSDGIQLSAANDSSSITG